MFEAVFSGVWQAFGVDREELVGPVRNRFVARARFAACIVLRENGATLLQMRSVLRRDQSTISEGIETGLQIAGERPGREMCREFSSRLDYLRKLTKQALEAERAAKHPSQGPGGKCPPAANLARRSGEGIEAELTRAMVEAGSAKLGRLLALERGGSA